ncbi:MAG: O-antigen ligase family protein [Synergistaceae bacterium]|nr:O-antigen ligase family protein [Synergistaceae bacterium]
MKKNKTQPSLSLKKIPEKYTQLPLVPEYILLPLWLISLALPNLIYSGINFADTLHILKWTAAGVPVGIAAIAAGFRIMRYGSERVKVKLDIFAVIWLVILAYCALMPLWVEIMSPTAFYLEMLCFLTVWVFYVLSVSSFPAWGLRTVLVFANLNAAVNVMFAELQIRSMNNLAFLNGTVFSELQKISSIILPTPGNYIGNTAQQNMFGLWVAVATLGAVYMFVYDAWKDEPSEHGRKVWCPAACVALAVILLKFAVTEASVILGVIAAAFILVAFVSVMKLGGGKRGCFSVSVLLLMAVNFWGLMNSTSRSATIALGLGLFVMLLSAVWKFDRNYTFRFLAAMMVIACVFWASLYSPRSGQIVDKTADIIRNAENIGNRRGIWTTSWSMFLEHPEGVGIGQYKWHYIEGQRYGFSRVHESWYRWQYTHWAHNEFLQFFCEGGYIGGTLLLVMWLAWFIPALSGLIRRERHSISVNAVWGISLVTLITFCAVFTRPFHRIENMVWITLAFALSNREFFPAKLSFETVRSSFVRKTLGVVCILSSIAGFVYISSGIYGNWLLRQALATNDERMQLYYLNEAQKHPIVREDTLRNLGYHYIQLGEQTNSNDDLVRGFNLLWEHFNREPHSEDISRLLNFAQRYQIEPVIREIASYFKPGEYHLQRVPQRDSNGNTVNALLLMNGPGSDDE